MRAMRAVNGRSGQVMVLACVTLLLLALSMMASFSMASAIHERVRIQAHADAEAYSVAVLEARAMNLTAYLNRAIAAMVVANMSVHAWMTIASQTAAILQAGSDAFWMLMGIEFAWCVCPGPCQLQHLPHGLAAIPVALRYQEASLKYARRVRQHERTFDETVKAFDDAVVSLHDYQKAVLSAVQAEISAEGGVLRDLRSRNAPNSSYAAPVFLINSREFACAFEGSAQDSTCEKFDGARAPDKATPRDRSVVLENAANAARGRFQAGCPGCSANGHADFLPFVSTYLRGLQNDSGVFAFDYDMNARVGERLGSPRATTAEAAENLGAVSRGSFFVSGFQGCWLSFGVASFEASTFSSDSGGAHSPGHEPGHQHDRFTGMQRSDLCSGEPCFLNFRATADRAGDFGQPSVFGAVEQDLGRLRKKGNQRGAWEVNADAKVTVNLGLGSATVRLKPPDRGLAVAKAKVYFHQLGDWRVAPNLFDPFWRAKLHPFTRAEEQKLLTLLGDTAGASLVASGGLPVEGDDR